MQLSKHKFKNLAQKSRKSIKKKRERKRGKVGYWEGEGDLDVVRKLSEGLIGI